MLNWNDIRVFLTVPSKGQLLLLGMVAVLQSGDGLDDAVPDLVPCFRHEELYHAL